MTLNFEKQLNYSADKIKNIQEEKSVLKKSQEEPELKINH